MILVRMSIPLKNVKIIRSKIIKEKYKLLYFASLSFKYLKLASNKIMTIKNSIVWKISKADEKGGVKYWLILNVMLLEIKEKTKLFKKKRITWLIMKGKNEKGSKVIVRTKRKFNENLILLRK